MSDAKHSTEANSNSDQSSGAGSSMFHGVLETRAFDVGVMSCWRNGLLPYCDHHHGPKHRRRSVSLCECQGTTSELLGSAEWVWILELPGPWLYADFFNQKLQNNTYSPFKWAVALVCLFLHLQVSSIQAGSPFI